MLVGLHQCPEKCQTVFRCSSNTRPVVPASWWYRQVLGRKSIFQAQGLSECQSPIAGALVKLLIWADVVNRRALAPCQKQMVCLPGIFLWVLRLPF
mgnify:CR=1 FL=1